MSQVWPPDFDPPEGSLAARFVEERTRKGYTQETIARELKVGIQKIKHMEGLLGNPIKNFTAMHFARMAFLGMDINYILGGERTIELSAEERALLDNYRVASAANKDHLKAVGAALTQSELTVGALATVAGNAVGLVSSEFESVPTTAPVPTVVHATFNDDLILKQFWRLVRNLQAKGEFVSHCKDDDKLAISIPHLERLAKSYRLHMPKVKSSRELTQALQKGKVSGYRYIVYKSVRSIITGKSVKCWVFQVCD